MADMAHDSTHTARTRHHGESETFNGRTGTVIVLPNRALPGMYYVVYRIYQEYNAVTRQWLELADATAHFPDGKSMGSSGRVTDYKTMLELQEAYRAYWRRQRAYELQQPDAHLEQAYEDRVSGSNAWFEDEE